MQSQTFHIGGNGGISIAAEATGNADALPVLLAHAWRVQAQRQPYSLAVPPCKHSLISRYSRN